MKRFVFSIAFLSSFHPSFATIRTVCNMPYSPGQFTTFAAALAASSVNDTIYVHGSNINYGTISVNKNGIVIIGAGHNPAKTVSLASSFTTINLSASGCQFIGLSFDIMIAFGTSNSTTVKRCKVQASSSSEGISISGSNGNNWLIEGNVFNGGTVFASINFGSSTSNNTTIRNNIFNHGIYSNSSSTTPFTLLILNNVFIGNLSNTFSSISNAVIDNNIFYRSSPQGVSTGCVMDYNISFSCSNNNFAAPGSNNLVNVNPLFTNFPLAGALFSYTHDYNLAAGSPGIVTGADGTDRGVYGGFGTKFIMTGEPPLAEVTDVTITSPSTIPPGGNLTISISSTRIK